MVPRLFNATTTAASAVVACTCLAAYTSTGIIAPWPVLITRLGRYTRSQSCLMAPEELGFVATAHEPYRGNPMWGDPPRRSRLAPGRSQAWL